MDSTDSCSPTDLAMKDWKKLITSGYLFCILKVFSYCYGSKTALHSDPLKYQTINMNFTSNN